MINVEFESYTSLRKEGSKGMQMVLTTGQQPGSGSLVGDTELRRRPRERKS